MKTKKAMSHQETDKAPITFQDVAACFSDEEWKLLHEWQKELYNIVMKEIHQAWISLGPVIATSVFSLRATEKEHLHPADHQDSEERHNNDHSLSAAISNSDVPGFGSDSNLFLKEPQYTDRRESRDQLSIGLPSLNSDITLRVEQEVEETLMGDDATKDGQNSTGHISGDSIDNSDVLFRIKGEETQDTDRRQSDDCLSTVVPFSIKEEGKAYTMDHQDFVRRENINSPTSDPVITPVFSVSLKPNEDTHVKGEPDSGDRTTGDQTDTSVSSLLLKPMAETPIQDESDRITIGSPVLNDISCTVDQSSKASPGSEAVESNALPNSVCQATTGIIKRKYAYHCKECEKSFTRKKHLVLHQKIHTESRPFPCTKFKKKFNLKGNVLWNQQIQNEERLFSCTECDKSFSQDISLQKHQRTHTRARPFSCTDCDKRFCHKSHLLQHHITHTREKPFSCTECDRNFSRNTSLQRHQRIHSGDRPFSCTECDKSFIQKSDLLKHQHRIHMRQTPFSCTQCNMNFCQKSDLLQHHKCHTI